MSEFVAGDVNKMWYETQILHLYVKENVEKMM